MISITLLLILGLSVVIHELGHFVLARINHVRVYSFNIFFSPFFSLLSYDPRANTLNIISRDIVQTDSFGKKFVTRVPKFAIRLGKPHPDTTPGSWRNTIYTLGWLPFGGSCHLADRYLLGGATPMPFELSAKSPMRRLSVHIAGVTFNILSALIASIAIYFCATTTTSDPQPYTFTATDKAQGFQDNDIITAIEGIPFDPARPGECATLLYYANTHGANISVTRDTHNMTIPVSPTTYDDTKPFCPLPASPLIVADSDTPDGLTPGDAIIAIDNHPVTTPREYNNIIQTSKTATHTITAHDTAGTQFDIAINTRTPIPLRNNDTAGTIRTHRFDIAYALSAGSAKWWSVITTFVTHPVSIFSDKSVYMLTQLEETATSTPINYAWYFVVLSVLFSLFNILPIPGLDGSRVLISIYEIISRRQFPEDMRLKIDRIGSFVILALIALAFL